MSAALCDGFSVQFVAIIFSDTIILTAAKAAVTHRASCLIASRENVRGDTRAWSSTRESPGIFHRHIKAPLESYAEP
jgi:hypothetical protein